ncbi:uncharacterized protein LOC124808982 isoform X2 [Hydra vulgaris]|uniref:uncharacterized protein LOC124808982 isoform X2 n=1 Tax=Hydra vulgaris TaxID=6087 RepID=UPI001F5EB120|nr:uncharacterized protein LOC124808982 isoform X2 [Hydra vulgaris]
MEYTSQKYVLIYCLTDKSIAIVHVDDVVGWNSDEFEKLKICRRVELRVKNDDSMIKVLVLQCGANYDALKETLKFVSEMKRKKQTINFIQTYFNPVRGLNRQRLPPVYPLHTASEDSNLDTDFCSESVATHNQESVCKSVALKPLPPLKPFNFHFKQTSSNENNIQASPNFSSTNSSFQLNVSSNSDSQAILSPRDSSDASLLRMHESMIDVCNRLNVEPFSAQGHFLMNAYVLRELSSIQLKLTNIEQRQARLEARVVSDPVDQICQIQFPIFTFRLQYSDVEKHPKNMLSWMKLEGGVTAHDHISRVLNKLLSHGLQEVINRPGTHGKLKFFDHLENLLKISTVHFFPGITAKEIELKVARFFNNARDRSGGRLLRFKKKAEVSIEEEKDNDSEVRSEEDNENDNDFRQKRRKTFSNN